MTADLDELLAVAMAAATAVLPALAADNARDDLGIDTKSSATDMVTAMDRWAESTIVDTIRLARPCDGFIGEEGASEPGTTGVVWVIDPIDGTTNFIRDLPGFSVSIAARVNGVDAVGLVHDPIRSERFTAVLGQGAFCNDDRLQVSAPVDLSRTVLATGFNYQPSVRTEQAEVLRELLPRIADIRRFGGAAIDCCNVAAGRLDAYYEVGVQDWDVAAGRLLVHEAGGLSRDFRPGLPFVCGSPSIFDDLLEALGLSD